MEKSIGKIGIREYVAIIILLVAVKNADGTTALLVEHSGSAYWILPLIILVISVIPLYLMMKVITLYKDKNLHDCNVHLFGKYIGSLISFVLFIFGICTLITDSAAYVDIIGTMYFSQTPTIILSVVLMAGSAYIAQKGLENIGTVAWSVLFYLIGALSFSLILALQDGNVSFLHPIFGPGIWDVVKDGTFHMSIYTEFFFLGLIAPYIVSSKSYTKGTVIGLMVVTILLCFSYLTYLLVFDYKGLQTVSYPYHELIRVVRFGFLTNLESFIFPFWIIVTFIRFSFYLYLMALLLGAIFQIKNFEYLTPTLAAIVVIFGTAIEAPSFTTFFIRENVLGNIGIIFLALPCLMWLVAKIKGEFKHDQATNNR